MYAKRLQAYDFKCFGKADMELQYPGRTLGALSDIDNVNLILGDNGGGKSSALRALAVAMLAPALLESGFVPDRLVRRVRPGQEPVETSLLKVEGVPDHGERISGLKRRRKLELLARIDLRARGSLDRLHLDSTPDSPIAELLADSVSPAFFIVGYGATRRVETGDYSASSARRSRGPRYQRIAGLFEDHVGLRPLQAWLPKLKSRSPDRYKDVIATINSVLPSNVQMTGATNSEEQYVFDCNGLATPFPSLSDGFKAFVGWVGDLLGHMSEVAADSMSIAQMGGIVLVDEIDLHLHPAWQRVVVPNLAETFPRLQFVFTSHSPLIAGTVKRENVFVTDQADDGTAIIKQFDENTYGRSIEQLLVSSYFGLNTTRPESFQDEARLLFRRAAEGDTRAALQYLKKLTGTPSRRRVKR
jgi:AAA domain, putative AbiEii toxin, Type IV TA system